MRRSVTLGVMLLTSALVVRDAWAIPAWARRYNMNCSACHYPAPPRLNTQGIQFRWAGFRMPEEIGETVSAEQVSNYIAAQGRVVYSLTRTGGQTATAVDAAEATIWYAGALGKHYVGWFEFNRGPDGTIDLGAQIGGVWGAEHSFGGFKVGQGHYLFENGVAGFDRNVALTDMPLPLEEPLTAGVPFAVATDRVGGEAFWVRGRNRLSIEVLEPVAGLSSSLNNRKDVVLMDQLLLDRKGAGIQVTALYGSLLGVDSSFANARSNYWRLAASASHFIGGFELLGGVVLGQDNDLPTGGTSPFTTSTIKGSGYWVSGQLVVPQTPLALYVRYEFSDPNTSVSGDATQRVVLGGVLPLTLPEYLRLNIEYSQRSPQTGSNASNLAAGLTVAF